jgi:hypothetical protein
VREGWRSWIIPYWANRDCGSFSTKPGEPVKARLAQTLRALERPEGPTYRSPGERSCEKFGWCRPLGLRGYRKRTPEGVRQPSEAGFFHSFSGLGLKLAVFFKP